jgi:hypothetical protein
MMSKQYDPEQNGTVQYYLWDIQSRSTVRCKTCWSSIFYTLFEKLFEALANTNLLEHLSALTLIVISTGCLDQSIKTC